VTPRGQRLMCLEVARVTYHYYDLFRHRLTPLRTLLRSCIASSPSTLSEARRPNFTPAPSSSGEAPPDVIIQDIREGGKKRQEQCRQETKTTAGDDGGSTIKRAALTWHALWPL
jgi:hypothetical protein